MAEPSDEDLAALLQELHDKQLLDVDHMDELRFELANNKEFGCIRILAILDAKVEKNELTREAADRYIDKLGFSEHYIEDRRKGLREKQFQQKKLN
ncbi:hypothetical protein JNK62_00090 [bacterium]|nr:hypothetical protein [bacterium]